MVIERRTRQAELFALIRCRLSVEEVIHHDDVFSVVIRAGRDVAGYDPHSSKPSVAKNNTDERQVSVTRRGRRVTSEKQVAVGAVVLDQSAGVTVSCPVSQSAAIRGVDVGKNHAKPSGRRWCVAIAARNGKPDFGDVTPDRREEPQWAKHAEDCGVARVPKRVRQARRRSLDEAASACGDVGAAGVQERG